MKHEPPARRTRLCYFTNVYPAPSHTTMRREIRALERQGANVLRVAARRFKGALVEAEDQEELLVTTYTAESPVRGLMAFCAVAMRHPVRLARVLWTACTVGRSSRRGPVIHLLYVVEACVLLRAAADCDHIHANFGNATGIATLCRQLGGPPVSLRIHGPEEFESFSGREWKWKLDHASLVAAISDHGVQLLKRAVDASRHDRIKLLRCGIEALDLGPTPVPLPAALHLVCVARLEERKGHAVLLEAMSRLRQDGVFVSLELVGDGSLRDKLEQQIRESGLSGVVSFAGWCDEAGVRATLQRARVVVLPSAAEGLPIVLMEAYAAGRAVVATRVAGIPELVRPGLTGWLVEAGDAPALAAALKEALASPDSHLCALAQAGRERVRQQHQVDVLMHELLASLRDPHQFGTSVVGASGAG